MECSNECHRVKDLQKEGNEWPWTTKVCPAEDCEPADNHSLASGIVFEFVGAAKSRLGNHCLTKRCGGECTWQGLMNRKSSFDSFEGGNVHVRGESLDASVRVGALSKNDSFYSTIINTHPPKRICTQYHNSAAFYPWQKRFTGSFSFLFITAKIFGMPTNRPYNWPF